uniref:Uncharacterized protein n=1 Tax=Glossina brevipalpis TaxID=37001 RepID=A0A1A9WN98_9MUSC
MENNIKSRKSLFGDSSHKQIADVANSDISIRLSTERRKAMDALRKSEDADLFKKPHPRKMIPYPSDVSHYTLFRDPGIINISDLVTDQTINLENNTTNSFSSSLLKDNTISFEPAEMTGRSTQLKKNSKENQQSEAKSMTVEEIIATSFISDKRTLCENLRNPNNTTHSVPSECSSFTSYNKMHSLPRTADMSLSRSSKSFNDFSGTITFNEEEEYSPGELMLSKFLSDEISFAEKFAAIPTKTLSAQAKERIGQSKFETTARLDTTEALHEMMNFSLGNYFNKFSEEISNIIPTKIVNKRCYNENENVTRLEPEACKAQTNLRISNMNSASHYTPVLNAEALNPPRPKPAHDEESKDSGNATEISYRESVCAFERALRESGINEWDELNNNEMMTTDQVKKPKFIAHPVHPKQTNSGGNFLNENTYQAIENFSSVKQIILENKENLDPLAINCTITDGDDKFGNTDGNMRKQTRNNDVEARLPLSPIEIGVVNSGDFIKQNSIHNESKRSILSYYEEENRTKSSDNFRSSKRSNNKSPSKSCRSACSENSVADDFVIAASPNLRFSKKIVKPIENENILPSHCLLEESSPQNPVSPLLSPHSQLQLPSPSHINNNRNSLMSDVISSTDYDLVNDVAVNCKSPGDREASSSPCFTVISAQASSRSSSGSSTRDGKLVPIKTSAAELSWNSTKLRSDSQKTMHIKNTSNKRLLLRVEVVGPGFQILSDHGNSTIVLQSQEIRAITVNFYPTVRGVAVGNVSFYAPSYKSIVGDLPFLVVPLYAYGGHASVIVKNVLKGPVGCPFLPMGELSELGRPMERAITIYNKGPLEAFVSVKMDTIGLLIPSLSDTFEIRPEKLIIAAGNTMEVRIIFRPKRELIRKIMKKVNADSVIALANLRVIYGNEASRQRFLRLFERMNEDQRSRIPLHNIEMFTSFPGEKTIDELKLLKDHPNSFVDMFCSFRLTEIQATLNHDLMNDTMETTSSFPSEADDTIFFRSIYLADTPISAPKVEENNVYCNDVDRKQKQPEKLTGKESWWVTPEVIELNLDHIGCVSSIFIHNNFKSRQYFEVICSHRNFLQFEPAAGYIEPGFEQVEVKIIPANGSQFRNPSTNISVVICMGNQRTGVPVKFLK